METNTGKESIVSRLFGFGKKRKEEPQAPESDAGSERGFARADGVEAGGDIEDGDEPSITVPEQVIRIRTSSRKDEAVTAIGESFRELTLTLSSVNERLDRSDSRAGVLAEQLSELPEYLRALPRLQEEQNHALGAVARAAEEQASALKDVARIQAEQTGALVDQTSALQEQVRVMDRIPDAVRESTAAQEQAIRKVAAAQQQTAKVMHHSHQKTLQAFQQASQKSMQQQQRQMEQVLASSQRMFRNAAIFMGIAVLAVVAVLVFG